MGAYFQDVRARVPNRVEHCFRPCPLRQVTRALPAVEQRIYPLDEFLLLARLRQVRVTLVIEPSDDVLQLIDRIVTRLVPKVLNDRE
jgi:hypothetical protein